MLIGSKSQYYKKLTSANAKMEEYEQLKKDHAEEIEYFNYFLLTIFFIA